MSFFTVFPRVVSLALYILFLLYISPLGDVMRQHNVDFHLYADDKKLYITFESSSADLAKLGEEDGGWGRGLNR